MKKLLITGASGFVGSRNISKISRQYGAKCLVCSSDQVYQGNCRKGPHREEESIEPVNLYGQEKSFCGLWRIMRCRVDVMVRTAWEIFRRGLLVFFEKGEKNPNT